MRLSTTIPPFHHTMLTFLAYCLTIQMFRSIVLALTLASASAFVAPSARVAAPRTVVQNQYKDEIGAQIPLGYWDPLALLENADQAKFDRLRFTEIKHGRISMLAVVGYLFGASNVRWAGFADLEHTLKFADVPGRCQQSCID